MRVEGTLAGSTLLLLGALVATACNVQLLAIVLVTVAMIGVVAVMAMV